MWPTYVKYIKFSTVIETYNGILGHTTPCYFFVFFICRARHRLISIIVPQDPRGQIAQASNNREELRIYTMIWVLEDKTTQKREYTLFTVYMSFRCFEFDGVTYDILS